MYSLSSRCIRNGIQASPLSIQIVLSLREALRHAVHDPVGQVQHVEPGEAQRVHGDEAVGHRAGSDRAQLNAAWKASGRPRSSQRGVGLHVGVVVDAACNAARSP